MPRKHIFEVLVTRFHTNEILEENRKYRLDHGLECIYGSPTAMPEKVGAGQPVFVIEMNNEENQVSGIGLVLNRPLTNHCIHKDEQSNQFVFVGKYFMTREDILENNCPLLFFLETLLFKGKTNTKRGVGFTAFKILRHVDKCLEIMDAVLAKEQDTLRFMHNVCDHGYDVFTEIRNLFLFLFEDNNKTTTSSVSQVEAMEEVEASSDFELLDGEEIEVCD